MRPLCWKNYEIPYEKGLGAGICCTKASHSSFPTCRANRRKQGVIGLRQLKPPIVAAAPAIGQTSLLHAQARQRLTSLGAEPASGMLVGHFLNLDCVDLPDVSEDAFPLSRRGGLLQYGFELIHSSGGNRQVVVC